MPALHTSSRLPRSGNAALAGGALVQAALGIEVASDAVQTTLADIDIDEILAHSSIPGLSELTRVASFGMSVGASGLLLQALE